jgi:hypothetical protein
MTVFDATQPRRRSGLGAKGAFRVAMAIQLIENHKRQADGYPGWLGFRGPVLWASRGGRP